jgi:hypothetical protein
MSNKYSQKKREHLTNFIHDTFFSCNVDQNFISCFDKVLNGDTIQSLFNEGESELFIIASTIYIVAIELYLSPTGNDKEIKDRNLTLKTKLKSFYASLKLATPGSELQEALALEIINLEDQLNNVSQAIELFEAANKLFDIGSKSGSQFISDTLAKFGYSEDFYTLMEIATKQKSRSEIYNYEISWEKIRRKRNKKLCLDKLFDMVTNSYTK